MMDYGLPTCVAEGNAQLCCSCMCVVDFGGLCIVPSPVLDC
jgi:hypothetical protein